MPSKRSVSAWPRRRDFTRPDRALGSGDQDNERGIAMKGRIMRAATRPTSKAEPANFVGTVLSDPVFAPEQPSRLRASRVSFMPGGRTNWHQHAVGQILYVLSGVGRYQLDGEPVQEIRPGDTVVIPP